MRFFLRVILGALIIALMGMGLTPQAAYADFPGCRENAPKIANPEEPPPPGVLFRKVRIFNGLTDGLSGESDVLVIHNKINKISATPIVLPDLIKLEDGQEIAKKDVQTINGTGHVMMPGLIDDHIHILMSANQLTTELLNPEAKCQLYPNARKEAKNILMRGFTAVRDLGGPVFDLKAEIDRSDYWSLTEQERTNLEERTPGPRIYPSGATISQTSGHGDFGEPDARPRRFGGGNSYAEDLRATIIADGRDEVLTATRENLRLGASQIKLMAGGGVSSNYDPLDVVEYTADELKAAVDAASDWGTYVTVHVYNDKGIERAVNAGVKSIEHGHLMSEKTMKLLAKEGVWLSAQVFELQSESESALSGENLVKQNEVAKGTANLFNWAKKYNVNLAWGTDLLFQPDKTYLQNSFIPKLKTWLSNFEVLKLVTHDNAQLLALSGPRNPYPGELGVIKEGAYADLLLVDGNPLDDLEVLGDYKLAISPLIFNEEETDNKPEFTMINHFKVIMKDGKIYKNEISPDVTDDGAV
ncbi:metal-dependent hydrolase family protein [Microseira wollei]|uniref:Amidohydrolase-related domain-containing protein n=1 Tax=Microseira wollei NIES-4236 TaxID=2530354 RepID=A0AAV3XRB6_9CYAN|nr:amidohydrolase family protein [Microseira wollei]GET43409.1 hypothetical protein MiSe_82320 [Microseira wollei NIES-4236]